MKKLSCGRIAVPAFLHLLISMSIKQQRHWEAFCLWIEMAGEIAMYQTHLLYNSRKILQHEQNNIWYLQDDWINTIQICYTLQMVN